MVQGMHCASCALALERSLLGLAGVVAAQVSAASGRASVVWSAALTRPSAWLAAPLTLGYTLTPASSAFVPDESRKQTRLALWRWLVAGFCMMQVMMYAVPGYLAALELRAKGSGESWVNNWAMASGKFAGSGAACGELLIDIM